MDIDPKDSQTFFSKPHNMRYSQSYIMTCHSTTCWINHVCSHHDKRNSFMSNAALENHCTRTAWWLQIGCCRRRHNIYRLSVHGWQKKVIFLSIFYFKYSALIIVTSLIYPAVCLLYKDLCELSITRYNTWAMPKRMIFWIICLLYLV